jgi:hypothetical protein
MTAPDLPANVRAIETPNGVCYRFTRVSGGASSLLFFAGAVAAVPLAAAVVAVLFLVRHARDVSAPLLALGCLFPLQMVFLARAPLGLFLESVWQSLVGALGHRELEVRGPWLALGSRIGPVPRHERRALADVSGLTVYVYGDPGAGPAGASPERTCLAAECGEAGRWLLLDGWSRAETVALAEDLNRRLEAVPDPAGRVRRFPPVAVVETTQEALYPGTGRGARPGKLWRLGCHVAGTAGLVALAVAAWQTPDWDNPHTRLCLLGAGLVEALAIGWTLGGPGRSAGTS